MKEYFFTQSELAKLSIQQCTFDFNFCGTNGLHRQLSGTLIGFASCTSTKLPRGCNVT